MLGAHHALPLPECTAKPMSNGEAFFDTNLVLCTTVTVVDASHKTSTPDQD